MKKIDAVIMPFKLDSVKDVLCGLGLQGMTITEIKVSGEQNTHGGLLRRPDHSIEFIPKLKIEIIVPDSVVEKAVEMISKSVNIHCDKSDSIFISHVDEAVRIRTAQKGDEAIT